MSPRRKLLGLGEGWRFIWLPICLACAPARHSKDVRPAKEAKSRALEIERSPQQLGPESQLGSQASDAQPQAAGSSSTPSKGETLTSQVTRRFCSGAALDEALRSPKATPSEELTRLEPAPRPSTGFKDVSLGPAYFGVPDLNFDGIADSVFMLRRGAQVRFFFFSQKQPCDEFMFSLDGLQVEGRERRGRLDLRVFLGENSPGGLRHFTYDGAKGLRERPKVGESPEELGQASDP